jgi:hypothetical protein
MQFESGQVGDGGGGGGLLVVVVVTVQKLVTIETKEMRTYTR